MIAASAGRFRIVDTSRVNLKAEDRPEPPVTDVISAVTEMQLIELSSVIGASEHAVHLAFRGCTCTHERELLRLAWGKLRHAETLVMAVLGSTTRNT